MISPLLQQLPKEERITKLREEMEWYQTQADAIGPRFDAGKYLAAVNEYKRELEKPDNQ